LCLYTEALAVTTEYSVAIVDRDYFWGRFGQPGEERILILQSGKADYCELAGSVEEVRRKWGGWRFVDSEVVNCGELHLRK